MSQTVKLGGELVPQTVSKIALDAKYIIDRENNGVKQSDINHAVGNLSGGSNFVTLLATIADTNIGAVFTRENVTPAVNTLYRIGNWKHDGSPKYNVNYYSVYGANGTTIDDLVPVALSEIGIDTQPTPGSTNLITSGAVAASIVYDISAAHSGAGYETLAAALGTNGNNVPDSVRKGGMSIKFIKTTPASYSVVKTEGLETQPTGTEVSVNPNINSGTYTAAQLNGAFSTLPTSSALTYWMAVSGETTTYTKWVISLVQNSDNKYVQYRLMSDTFNTTLANWQGIDDEPTDGSNNLVKSGGVKQALDKEALEVGFYQNINGNDNTASYGQVINIRDTTSIIVVPQKFSWSQENVTGAIFFVQKSENGKTNWDSIPGTGASKGGVVSPFYEITPDGTYNYIRLAIRADVGETVDFDVVATKSISHQFLKFKKDVQDYLAEGYVYAGIATAATAPGTPSGKVFYVATAAGTYTNFNSLVLTQGINVLKYNGTAWSVEQIWGVDDEPTAGSENLIKSGGVKQALDKEALERGFYNNISGNDNTAAYGQIIDVRGATSIVIAPQKFSWPQNNVTGTIFFVQKSENGTSNWNSIPGTGVSKGGVVSPFYEITPDGTYNYIRLAIRADVGESVDFDVVTTNSISHQFLKFRKDVQDYQSVRERAVAISMPNDTTKAKTYMLAASNANLNTAIEDLHNIGGGVINLLNWNTNGLPIQMAYDDVALVGLSPEYTRIGTTQQAGSIVVGDGVTAKVSNIHFNAMYKCKKNSKLILHNVVIEHPLQSIGTIHFDGEAPSVYYMCSSDSSSKAYFFEEISTSDDAGAAIQSTLDNYTEVYLAIGTYNTTTTIKLNSNNLLSCVSQTYRASINRQQSGNYCIMANTNAKNTTVQRLYCNSFIRLDMNNGENGHLIDTVFNGKYLAKDVWVACKGVNTFKLGKNFNESLTLQGIIELLTYPYRVVYDDNSVKYRIEVYGKCSETNANSVNINDTLEIEGMTDDAELSFTINNNQSALCLYDREGEENHTSIKNLKLTMYGTYGGWQYGVLHVGSNWAYLENLEIRNYHDCATPRSASDIDTAPNTVVDGDRKQGCVISINHYDNDCHTEFHNVKSYGSPYGFKNCRGFYVMRGSPKFYNCVGVGGGYGRYGYGWVLHHASKPYMYNCIGIGSPYGWGLNNGIQFQMNTEALLFNCIGIGNTNKQRYSNGNKNMVVLNTLSEASHGYCCYMEVHPTLMNCVGYAADVDGSYAFAAGFDSRPQIEGGYYGKEVKVICNKVSLTDDVTSQVIDAGNSLYPTELKCIGFRDTLANMPTGQKVVIKVDGTIICEATESVQQQCPPISNPIVPTGSVVTCEVVDSNNEPVSNANLNFDVIVRYMGHNQMTAIYIENSASPRIRHATLSGNLLADGLHINCPDTADYLIDECTIDVPSTNYAIKSSSQKAVKVVNCVMTSGNVQNVTFVQTTTLGSNVVI